MSTTVSAISSYNLMKKSLPFSISKPSPCLLQIYNTKMFMGRSHPLSLRGSKLVAFSSINPPGQTPPEFPNTSPPDEVTFSVPDEMPRTPNVPDFDPIPPEKPLEPPPLSPPGLNPEFPGPPVPERPGPEGPQPPMSPPPGPGIDMPKGPPGVVPPHGPEIVPSEPPDVGSFPTTSPEISGPIGDFVYM